MKSKNSGMCRERFLRSRPLILLILCSVVILLAACLLLLHRLSSTEEDRQTAQEITVLSSQAAASPTPAVSQNTEQTEKGFDPYNTQRPPRRLHVSSADRDLLISVTDSEDQPISDEEYRLVLSDDEGETHYFTTNNGSCHIVALDPGEYTLTLYDEEGYARCESVRCQVVGTPIGTESTSSQLLLDDQGNPQYRYTIHTGRNGFLLYRDSQEESDVIPVDEDGDGVADYGLRYRSAAEAESGSRAASFFETVTLYHADNTPLEEYAISAEPLLKPASEIPYGWQKKDGKLYYYNANGQAVTGLQKIDGKLYYFNPYGEKARSLGVDVSCFNGRVNWSLVREQGIDFAIIRVGGRGWQSGLAYTDTQLSDHLAGAGDAGLQLGVYFYSTAATPDEAMQEADMILTQLGGMALDLPIYFDMEFSGDYPYGRADQLSIAQRMDIVHAFCRVITASGYEAGVYSGESFLQTNIDYSAISRYSIWLANYTENNALPGYPYPFHIWQFTEQGIVSGMGSTVDLNVIF